MQYLSPGVYVEEVPSAVQAIAGVGTSTAGFIGVMPDTLLYPRQATTIVTNEAIGTGTANQTTFPLDEFPVDTTPGSFEIRVEGEVVNATLTNNFGTGVAGVTVTYNQRDNESVLGAITGSYSVIPIGVTDEVIGVGDGTRSTFNLAQYPVLTTRGEFTLRPQSGTSTSVSTTGETPGATISNDTTQGTAQVTFTTPPTSGTTIVASYAPVFSPVPAGAVRLCTNFSEFKRFFGDFSIDPGQNTLAHAVYGFFNNGGTRCYVVRAKSVGDITAQFLSRTFESIDEIAIVAAPGITDSNVRAAITTHCAQITQDRFAIFDSPETVVDAQGILDLTKLSRTSTSHVLPDNSNYAAFYFPWLQVFDPISRTLNPTGDGRRYVPPSGHIAGIYARVDSNRGVHKAPANEPIFGALGLRYEISRNQQDGLNPQGVNCIRTLNGNIRVWGARTLGGDANGEFRYINVRRLLLFLRESIDEGTQFAVFEPNDPGLWARITRNISDFLTTVWRSGALFGTTPQEAFYVKCDAETNPPEERELGRVITEVGVAVVRPAEFVIFRVSQFTPQS